MKENQRLIIYATYPPDEQLVYKDWPEGAKLSHLRRFEAGTASASIAVAPVTSKLAVDHTDVHCNEPVKVSWDSTNAAHTIIKANETPLAYAVAGAMEQRPLRTTKYEFHAAGPGGIVDSEATVNVDNTVKASLAPSTSEQRYVKVGDKFQEQGARNSSGRPQTQTPSRSTLLVLLPEPAETRPFIYRRRKIVLGLSMKRIPTRSRLRISAAAQPRA